MERSYQPGETVLIKNELSGNFFIIIRGRIKFELNGKRFFLSDGDFFGEEGVFFNKPNPFSVTAAEETQVQIFDRNEAKNFILHNHDAAFNMFIRNSARFSEGIEPVSDLSHVHIKILERITPFVSHSEGDFPEYEATTDIEKFSTMLQMTTDKMVNLLETVEPLGYVKLSSKGKILTSGKSRINKLIRRYYREMVFYGAEAGSGSGLFPLINVINKKEKKGINI